MDGYDKMNEYMIDRNDTLIDMIDRCDALIL